MTFASIKAVLRRLTGRGSFAIGPRFRSIYRANGFGGGESRSGPGSSLAETARIREELPRLFAELGIASVLDAPCGDCRWISELDWTGVAYTGADVVAELVASNRARFAGRPMAFLTADLCVDPLPRADLVLCRDCWVHLDTGQIRACLRNFQRSGAAYLLVTTFTARERNRGLHGAIWRPLNLQRRPFSFPPPLRLCVEGCSENGGAFADKALGLWRLADLAF